MMSVGGGCTRAGGLSIPQSSTVEGHGTPLSGGSPLNSGAVKGRHHALGPKGRGLEITVHSGEMFLSLPHLLRHSWGGGRGSGQRKPRTFPALAVCASLINVPGH